MSSKLLRTDASAEGSAPCRSGSAALRRDVRIASIGAVVHLQYTCRISVRLSDRRTPPFLKCSIWFRSPSYGNASGFVPVARDVRCEIVEGRHDAAYIPARETRAGPAAAL